MTTKENDQFLIPPNLTTCDNSATLITHAKADAYNYGLVVKMVKILSTKNYLAFF